MLLLLARQEELGIASFSVGGGWGSRRAEPSVAMMEWVRSHITFIRWISLNRGLLPPRSKHSH